MLLTEDLMQKEGLQQYGATVLWFSKPDLMGQSKTSVKCPDCKRFSEIKKATLNNAERKYFSLCEYCQCRTEVSLKNQFLKLEDKEVIDTKSGWF